MSGSELGGMLDGIMRSVREAREAQAKSLGVTLEELDAIEAKEQSQAEARKLADARLAKRRRVVDRCGSRMPESMRDAFLRGELRDTAALRAVHAWLAGSKHFLLLLGGTGVGKTVSALVALTELDGVFVRSPDLGPAIEPWKADLDRGVQTFDPSSPSLVVLDDLGLERAEDARWATSFDELCDARQGSRHGRPLRTLITSNLTTAQIAERYSDRARDRIRSSHERVILSGQSLRLGS